MLEDTSFVKGAVPWWLGPFHSLGPVPPKPPLHNETCSYLVVGKLYTVSLCAIVGPCRCFVSRKNQVSRHQEEASPYQRSSECVYEELQTTCAWTPSA